MRYANRALGKTIAVPVSATPVIVEGVGVIVGSDDGFVRFFDQGLRSIYWERRLPSSIYAPLVHDARHKRVIVAGTGGRLVALGLDGSVAWSNDIGHGIFASPFVSADGAEVIIAAFDGICSGVDLATGALTWKTYLPNCWAATIGATAAYRDPYASPVVAEDGTIVVCNGNRIVALDQCGAIRWNEDAGALVKSSPVLLPGGKEVLVCPVSGRLAVLDVSTGRIRRSLVLGAKVTASPAISEGIIAVGTQSGKTFGLTTSLSASWQTDIGAPRSYSSITVLPDGAFIFTCERGNVLCLEREDGVFRWESSQVLGLPDHDPVLDITPIAAPSGDMYCAGYSGFVYHFKFRPMAV